MRTAGEYPLCRACRKRGTILGVCRACATTSQLAALRDGQPTYPPLPNHYSSLYPPELLRSIESVNA